MKLKLVVFLTGFVVMVLELVGSRLLGPYVGTSIYVWTSLIGVILGCLSLGYWWGGKLADYEPSEKKLSVIILLSGICVAIIPLLHTYMTGSIVRLFTDARIAATFSAIVLFGIPAVLLGVVSPYTVKLRMKSLIHSGETVGQLYALSTLGSIVGTFVSGFFLLSYFGSINIIYVLAGILVITALICGGRYISKGVLILSFFIGISYLISSDVTRDLREKGILQFDTLYNHVMIITGTDQSTGRPLRVMKINNEHSSGMFPGSKELAFRYLEYYNLFEHFVPHAKDVLMIGGAGYTYATYFLDAYPERRMDVVEIDPAMADLASTYFNLPRSPDLRIFHQDGRIFLNNKENESYDVILGDAYASFYTVPFQLTTIECAQRMYETLKENGAVLLNVIASVDGDSGRFLRAEFATFSSVFPHVYVFPTRTQNPQDVQNIIMVALKSDNVPQLVSDNNYLQQMLRTEWTGQIANDVPVLRDDFAPVERYTSDIVLKRK